MPTLTIKSLPDALYDQLRRRAAAHRRSLNSEVLVCLEQAVASTPADPGATLARVDALRARLRVPPLTAATLRAAKASGRP